MNVDPSTIDPSQVVTIPAGELHKLGAQIDGMQQEIARLNREVQRFQSLTVLAMQERGRVRFTRSEIEGAFNGHRWHIEDPVDPETGTLTISVYRDAAEVPAPKPHAAAHPRAMMLPPQPGRPSLHVVK